MCQNSRKDQLARSDEVLMINISDLNVFRRTLAVFKIRYGVVSPFHLDNLFRAPTLQQQVALGRKFLVTIEIIYNLLLTNTPFKKKN